MTKNVLIVATSCDHLGDTSDPTGCWAEELMAPYLLFTEKGYDVTLVSMKGGKIPIDQGSLADQFVTDKVKEFQGNSDLMAKIENTPSIDEANAGADYDAIFVPGGHGPVFDMVDDARLQKILAEAFDAGKVVSSVCHGPIVFSNVKSAKSGKPIVAGRKVTGFSNSEEDAVQKRKYMPFMLEDKLKELGGDYEKKGDWEAFAIADGNLITGQNPQSSEAMAKHVIAALG